MSGIAATKEGSMAESTAKLLLHFVVDSAVRKPYARIGVVLTRLPTFFFRI